jgi:mRNA interferase MazF
LPEPAGSEPGYRRPVVIVLSDILNSSRIRTVICVAITSNLALAGAPGNVLLAQAESQLLRDSVANVSQIVTLDRSTLTERISQLPSETLEDILDGIELVLGRYLR